MAIVTFSRVGTGLTPEEMAMLEEAEALPQVYDEDCPKLTSSELAEFRPINGMTWQEREKLMIKEGMAGYQADPSRLIPLKTIK